MIKLKTQIMKILNTWFNGYFTNPKVSSNETRTFHYLKNFEFKVYQTNYNNPNSIYDLYVSAKYLIIFIQEKGNDDKLVNSALTTLDKIVNYLSNYIQSNFKVTL